MTRFIFIYIVSSHIDKNKILVDTSTFEARSLNQTYPYNKKKVFD